MQMFYPPVSYATLASGGGAATVADLAALKALTSRPEVVIVETGPAKGQWQWESGSSTTADDALVVTCTAGASGRYKRVYDGPVVATWWGILGDNSTDNVTTMSNLQTYLAAATSPPKVIWPAGIYRYSVSPNWAIADSIHEAAGEVRFRYTGTGNAVIIDGGATGAGVYGCRFGSADAPFIVEAPSSAQNGVYVRAVHHARLGFKVFGAGTTYAGMRTEWLVGCEISFVCSVNEEGWYASATPAIGLNLCAGARVGESGLTSDNTFVNTITEGPGIGINLTNTLQNVFVGGLSEGCATYGIVAETDSHGDVFYGMDLESNTTADIYNRGDGIQIIDCWTTNIVTFSAEAIGGEIKGGKHKSITLAAGSRTNRVHQLQYNRVDNPGGAITDSGSDNYVEYDTLIDGTNNFRQSKIRNRASFSDDFLGGALSATDWTTFKGSNGSATDPYVHESVGGRVLFASGIDAGGTMALNGTQLNAKARFWRASAGGFFAEFRILITPITDCAWFFGMTDQVAALEMPFTLSGTTLTSNATDAFGILFDTAATTDNFNLVGVANDVDATRQDLGVAPTSDVYEYWRIEVTTAGVVTAYRNGAAIGTAMSAAVTAGTALSPVMCGFSRSTVQAVAALDFISLGMKRP